MLTLTPTSTVAILGFGTRAGAFAALLAPRGCALRAWDPLLATADAARQRARIEAAGVDACADLSAALRGARLVVLDTAPAGALPDELAADREVLDLGGAPDARIEAALEAMGLPQAQGCWQAALAGDTALQGNPGPVKRGPLP